MQRAVSVTDAYERAGLSLFRLAALKICQADCGASERAGLSLLRLAALKMRQADCNALYPLPAPLNGRGTEFPLGWPAQAELSQSLPVARNSAHDRKLRGRRNFDNGGGGRSFAWAGPPKQNYVCRYPLHAILLQSLKYSQAECRAHLPSPLRQRGYRNLDSA